MRFSISHDFDAALDTIQLATLSPELGPSLGKALAPTVESVETAEHRLEAGDFHRVLRFQAGAPLPLFRGRTVPREALAWEMTFHYRLGDRVATWEVSPQPQYRRYFRASGEWRLESSEEGTCRRTVSGELHVTTALPLFGRLVERLALVEVRKIYDAEANTLRSLGTL